jgi:hypothetical protein
MNTLKGYGVKEVRRQTPLSIWALCVEIPSGLPATFHAADAIIAHRIAKEAHCGASEEVAAKPRLLHMILEF